MGLTIRGKLVAVVCLALLPVLLLGYLFVSQSQKDIAFSSKESLGTQYYAALASDPCGALGRRAAAIAGCLRSGPRRSRCDDGFLRARRDLCEAARVGARSCLFG
jgi:hypothetical protein